MSKMHADIRNLKKILAYVLKHKFALFMLVLMMAMYSAALFGQVWLSRYLMDDVLAPANMDVKKKALDSISGNKEETAEEKARRLKAEEAEREVLRKQRDTLFWIIIAAGCLGLVGAATHVGKEYYRRYLMHRAVVDIRTEVGLHMLTLSLDFYSERKGGDLINRMTNDLQVTQKALQFFLGDIVQAPIMIISGVVLAVVLSWQLSIVTFVILPLLLIILIHFGKKIRRHSRQSLERLAEVTEHMMQMFSGIRIVKAFGLHEFEKKDFAAANERYFAKAMKMVRDKVLAKGMLELFYTLCTVSLLFVGSILVINGTAGITLGVLIAFIGITVGLSTPLKNGVRAFTELAEAVAGSERVFSLLSLTPTIKDRPGARPIEKIEKSIAFKNVSFRYDKDEPYVFENLSFTAEVGKVYAFVGKTGAGKSTLLDLVCRFYEPTAGSIEIDGTDYRDFTLQSYLELIAIVGQHPFLFNASISENIRVGRLDATDDEVKRAADAALVTPFAEKKAEGFKTVAGERGENLSGGERQRVTIARALAKDSPILILDEATSSLDSASEQLVQQALENLMHGRTTFVVAHRLSTIQRSDKIFVLDSGRIVESGTHNELLSAGGLYSDLCRQQFGPAPHDNGRKTDESSD